LLSTLEVSTDLCVPAPADALRHAPLAAFVPCLMRAASPPTARGAVLQVLLVDRFHQPRYRSLDDRVPERRLPNRALAPIGLSSPPALYRQRLGAPLVYAYM